MGRRIANIDELIDIIAELKGGLFVNICYMSSAKVKKTLRGVDIDKFGTDLDSNRMTDDDEIYQTLKGYQQGSSKKFPYGGIVKMSTFQVHWQTEENYRKNYGKYAQSRDALLAKYGASVNSRDGYDALQSYGHGGVSVGSTDNTQGKLYTHQNGATVKNRKNEYYLVDMDGELKGGISYNAIASLVTKSGDKDGVSALRKVGATDEQIAEYLEELKKLNFSVLKLMFDSILFIVASVNGESIYFINSALARQVGSGNYTVPINQNSFIQKAQEIFDKNYKEIKEWNNNINLFDVNKIQISESIIHKALMESIQYFINEDNSKYIPNAVYIVNDGSSCYGVYGCDVEEEIMYNDAEVVKGPFKHWNAQVDDIIEQMNDEINGTSMYQ